MKKYLYLLCLTFCITQILNARTYYVTAGSGSDSNNGYSWANAKQTISSAITSASSGDSIFVSIGQYAGFQTVAGIHIYGGFIGTETFLYERQSLTYGYLSNNLCTEITSRIYNTSSFQSSSANVNLNGLVVKSTDNAAIYIQGHKINLSNCYISANTGNSFYWGVIMYSSSSISNCKIEKSQGVKILAVNRSNSNISNSIITYCTCPIYIDYITGGSSFSGSTSDMPIININKCIFFNNSFSFSTSSPAYRGFIYSETPAYINIYNCIFNNNSFISTGSYSEGIGIIMLIKSYFKIHQCIFANNTVRSQNGNTYIIGQYNGYSPTSYTVRKDKLIQNCTFANNVSETFGVSSSAYGIWTNTTNSGLSFYNNIRYNSGDIVFPVANDYFNANTGSVVAQNVLIDSLNSGTDSTKNYVRFVRPTTFAGAATNSADSLAIMQADWHLDSGSACIDAGYPYYNTLTYQDSTDLDGNHRVSGSRVDIGAYEYPQADAPQQIVWSQNLQGKRLSEGFVVATATATSGLPVTYTSGNTRVATVSHDTIFFQSRGNATITATQWGDSVYMPATPLGKMLTILDTIGVYDTIPVYDTVRSYDTIPVYDTLWHNDTIRTQVFDTLWTNDTIWYNDTTHTQVFDTTWTHLFDTIPVLDTTTIYIYDTIHVYDTIHIYDTTYVSIHNAEAMPWKIGQSGLNIIVSGAEGETVRVYDVSGRCLHVQPRAVGVLRFRMPTAGVYLVQVGGSPAQRIVLAARE